jgi:tRNA threonylcarbamoyl adenosine modification protein (Sua5/YciO/YrdC/YwlC family)
MLIYIPPDNPNSTNLRIVLECLRDGGVIIYPTDTVYGMGCDINRPEAVERICTIKKINPKKANFSFICHDLSHISDFTKHVDTPIYKLMKKTLPGPFTYILRANNKVPKLFKSKKKTVGIRVPDNDICREIVKELGNPLMSTSIHDEDNIIEYTTDPEIIYENHKNFVDIVVHGGFGKNEPSTVVDCSDGNITIIRQGVGNLDDYN